MSRLICTIFVADLLACTLQFFKSAVVDQQLQGCGVDSFCGSCRWCLLLLAGWCEVFYGVRESEALVAYVVLVPFLLVCSVVAQNG
jgi:hypothetical protein